MAPLTIQELKTALIAASVAVVMAAVLLTTLSFKIDALQASAIEASCAEYDSKTGKYQWIIKPE